MRIRYARVRAELRRIGITSRWLYVLLAQGARDFCRHGDVPGYKQLPWATRCRINTGALLIFCCSTDFVRLILWLTAWLLASYLLIWTRDLSGPSAAAPPLLALLWALPLTARARRAALASALGHRWPG